MPHLMRFSRDLEARLETLAETTGLSKSELITRCVEGGITALETQLLPIDSRAPDERSIDQVLRESGLGA